MAMKTHRNQTSRPIVYSVDWMSKPVPAFRSVHGQSHKRGAILVSYLAYVWGVRLTADMEASIHYQPALKQPLSDRIYGQMLP